MKYKPALADKYAKTIAWLVYDYVSEFRLNTVYSG